MSMVCFSFMRLMPAARTSTDKGLGFAVWMLNRDTCDVQNLVEVKALTQI